MFVEMPGSVQCSGKPACEVFVSQLSAHGCRLAGYGLDLQVGERVSLAFSFLDPMEAQVQWTTPETAGVELAVPLDPEILQHFAAYISHAA